MFMKKVLGVLAIASLTSACVATDYAGEELPYWSRGDASADNFRLERKHCVDEVEIGLYEESYVDPLFRQGLAGRRLAAMEWAKDAYLECMHQKGWQLADGVRIGAPGEIYYP